MAMVKSMPLVFNTQALCSKPPNPPKKNGSSKAAVGTTMTPIRLAEAKPDFPAAEKSPR